MVSDALDERDPRRQEALLRLAGEKLLLATQHLDAAIDALEDNCPDDALRILRSLVERWLALKL